MMVAQPLVVTKPVVSKTVTAIKSEISTLKA